MFKKISKYLKKFKIIIPVIVLLLIVFWLTFNLLDVEFKENTSLNKLKKNIYLTTEISLLIHEIQKERGMSAGFIISKSLNFKQKLQIQRISTNKMLKNLEDNVYNNKPISKPIQKKIEYLRSSIDTLSLNTNEAVSCYTNINTELMNIIISISKSSKFPSITQNLIAYSNFLYSKEYAGIERALGTQIISSKSINQTQINNFNSLIVKQNLFKFLFLKYSTKDLEIKQKKFTYLEAMRKIILSADKKKIHELDVDKWFQANTLKIEDLKNIDNQLISKILNMLKNRLTHSQKKLFIILLLNLFFVVLFIFMLFRLLSLLKSEQMLRALIDTHVIISETDLKGVITDTSKAFCHISGYSKSDLLGKSHNIIRHPDMKDNVFAGMWKTIENNKVWTGNVKNLRKDGSFYWVEAVISPKYENGKKIGYTALRQDITDKIKIGELNRTLEKKIVEEVDKHRQKDQQLFQQSRLAQMGEMISMIAHQWRQPLSAISSTSGAINLKARLGKLDNKTAQTLSEDISQYTKHLSTTIDDFREFFKSNKELKETNYSELVNGVLKIVESAIRTQHIELILELENNDNFYTYPNEIKQVILNLIKNAEDVLIEKEMKNPYIKIRTYREDTKLILEISDNGGGVPDEIKQNIFDPYFSTKTKKDGTGLGLYMSKTIIEEHCHGKLNLSNNDDGAVFKIILESENG